jgi:hypothetical protein
MTRVEMVSTNDQILELENGIGPLESISSPELIYHSTEGIYRIFIDLVQQGVFKLHRREEGDLLGERLLILLENFKQKCNALIGNEDCAEAAFSGAIQVLKIYTRSLPSEFPSAVFEDLIIACVLHKTAVTLVSKAMNDYGDLFLYGMRIIKKLLENAYITHQQAFELLSNINMTKDELKTFCFSNGKKWKKRAVEYSSTWMYVLQALPNTDRNLLKRILLILDDKVIPYLSSPSLLIDFLAGLFSRGGSIGWMSLNALFTLIRKHRLDYPRFYEQLLPMLTPDIMHSRYRRRFLSLLATFMRSTHITTVQLRSFLKRVARLSLSAPPSAARWIIPFCYNMLKQHEELFDMVHDPTCSTTDSLFELSVLFSHHVGPISRQAELLKDRMVRPEFNLDKYLKESDSFTLPSLLENELQHKWSRPPPLASNIPSKLYS